MIFKTLSRCTHKLPFSTLRLQREWNLYENLRKIIKVKRMNNIFLNKIRVKYYEIINNLKQLNQDKKQINNLRINI